MGLMGRRSKLKWRREKALPEAVTDVGTVEVDALETETGNVTEDIEEVEDVSKEAIAEMIEVATEAMEEIDLNADLTVVENILVEMIEIEVPEVVIDNLRFNLGTLLTIAGLYLIFNFKILCQIFMLSHCKL